MNVALANVLAVSRRQSENTRALPAEANEELRALVTKILLEDFGNKKNAVALALGVSAGFITDFLSGKRGAGNTLLAGLARYAEKNKKKYGTFEVGDYFRMAPKPAAPGQPIVQQPDPYPNRARILLSEEFRAMPDEVRADFVGMRPPEDLTEGGWWDALATSKRRFELGILVHGGGVRVTRTPR